MSLTTPAPLSQIQIAPKNDTRAAQNGVYLLLFFSKIALVGPSHYLLMHSAPPPPLSPSICCCGLRLRG